MTKDVTSPVAERPSGRWLTTRAPAQRPSRLESSSTHLNTGRRKRSFIIHCRDWVYRLRLRDRKGIGSSPDTEPRSVRPRGDQQAKRLARASTVNRSSYESTRTQHHCPIIEQQTRSGSALRAFIPRIDLRRCIRVRIHIRHHGNVVVQRRRDSRRASRQQFTFASCRRRRPHLPSYRGITPPLAAVSRTSRHRQCHSTEPHRPRRGQAKLRRRTFSAHPRSRMRTIGPPCHIRRRSRNSSHGSN